MIRVVDLKNITAARGELLQPVEEFRSWRSAWEYLEKDLHRSRNCPATKIERRGYYLGQYQGRIQHWSADCTCKEISEWPI